MWQCQDWEFANPKITQVGIIKVPGVFQLDYHQNLALECPDSIDLRIVTWLGTIFTSNLKQLSSQDDVAHAVDSWPCSPQSLLEHSPFCPFCLFERVISIGCILRVNKRHCSILDFWRNTHRLNNLNLKEKRKNSGLSDFPALQPNIFTWLLVDPSLFVIGPFFPSLPCQFSSHTVSKGRRSFRFSASFITREWEKEEAFLRLTQNLIDSSIWQKIYRHGAFEVGWVRTDCLDPCL